MAAVTTISARAETYPEENRAVSSKRDNSEKKKVISYLRERNDELEKRLTDLGKSMN